MLLRFMGIACALVTLGISSLVVSSLVWGQEAEKGSREILELCRQLESETPGIGYFAAGEKLAKIPSEHLIPGLRAALKDEELRDKVLRFISSYVEDKTILPDIVEIAKNQKGRSRLHAVGILGRLSDKRAIPILIEYCLDDSITILIDGGPPEPSLYANSVLIIARIINRWTQGALGKIPSVGSPTSESINKVRTQTREWWAENKEEFLKELEEEYGTTEIGGTEKKPPDKKDAQDKGTTPEEKKDKAKEPPFQKDVGKDSTGEPTPPAEVEQKPQPVEKPKPEAKPVVEEVEPGAGWLLPALIVADIVLAVIAAYLLLRRKK